MIKRGLLFFILVLLPFTLPGADIKENQLDGYKHSFMARVVKDNPGREAEIRECLGGMIKEGGAGVRLIDKFGLFFYDSSRNGLSMERVRFVKDGNSRIFIILLKDNADSSLYSLFLEYIYSPGRGTYSLGEIYFSDIFEEKMTSVKDFFGGD